MMFHVSIQLPLHQSYNGIMHTTCHDNVRKMFQIYMCVQYNVVLILLKLTTHTVNGLPKCCYLRQPTFS